MKKILTICLFILFFLPQTVNAQAFPNGSYYCASNETCLDTCNPDYESHCTILAGICTHPKQPTACTKSYLCDGETGIDTAIGCIPIGDNNETAAFFLRWGLGIAGGIAFLLIIFATFTIITSSGDPKRVQGGKELLTAAISGLFLIIFSVFILRLIGVNILGIF